MQGNRGFAYAVLYAAMNVASLLSGWTLDLFRITLRDGFGISGRPADSILNSGYRLYLVLGDSLLGLHPSAPQYTQYTSQTLIRPDKNKPSYSCWLCCILGTHPAGRPCLSTSWIAESGRLFCTCCQSNNRNCCCFDNVRSGGESAPQHLTLGSQGQYVPHNTVPAYESTPIPSCMQAEHASNMHARHTWQVQCLLAPMAGCMAATNPTLITPHPADPGFLLALLYLSSAVGHARAQL